MAQLDQKTFCSLCVNLLKDPVIIPCGHSFCMNCIEVHWGTHNGTYSCPQCSQTFIPRPKLLKNTTLASEEAKKTEIQAAPADQCYAGPEDVACDVCTGRKVKAANSCLVCLISFCEEHIQPHIESLAYEKHKLVKPSKILQENICSHHNEVMRMFCRTDQQVICYLCPADKHRDHNTVSVAEERTEKQRELEVSRENIQQRIHEREEDVQLLQKEVEVISNLADKSAEDSEEIFTQLISDVKQQIRLQKETSLSQIRELQKKLEQEITDLKRRDTELKNLSHTEDHNHFLHDYKSLSGSNKALHPSRISIDRLTYFDDVTAAVSELRHKIHDVVRQRTNISLTATEDDGWSEPQPKTREEFLKYSREITLDPNTANKWLYLSEDNRTATLTREEQSYPLYPDRFDWHQVLSREILTGRCYWEVEVRGGGVYLAVTYKNIRRAWRSHESGFGLNDKSWTLNCYNNSYDCWYDNVQTPISGPQCSRVGIYLDHSAGILSFYNISETTTTLLHSVQTTFTQPLYAGLGFLCYETTAEFWKVEQTGVDEDTENSLNSVS